MNNGENLNILERGHVFFFYRPLIEEKKPKGFQDVGRFFMLLHPEEGKQYRLLVIGKKKMPEEKGHESREWGFVESVESDIDAIKEEIEGGKYRTKTRGEKEIPRARPAGEGVYSIVLHEDHTHLAYALELPEKLDEVQKDLNIKKEGDYIVSVKNPESSSPAGAGLKEKQKADLPNHLQDKFGGRRFVPANPPDFLNFEGSEIILIESGKGVSSDLELNLDPQDESIHSAEVFSDLRLEKAAAIVGPLFEGQWK